MQRNGGGDDRVQNAFGDFTLGALGVGVQDGRVGHQVADVAQEHQRAAMQAHRFAAAIGRGVDAVGVQAARLGLAALGDFFGQRALQDAQPVGVTQHLVFGVHGSNRVFQVQDGGQRRLQNQVRHTGRVALADGGAAVNHDVDVQAVVHQQHRSGRGCTTLVAGELRGKLKAGAGAALQVHHQLAAFNAVAGGIFVRTAGQRGRGVQKMAGKGNHFGAAFFIEAGAFGTAVVFRDGVGAIQRVVQAAPARVGGVECVAGVQDRHHQLRAGLHGQLVVHVGGGGLHVAGLRNDIADGFQEFAVAGHVGNWAGVRLVPGVQLGLQAVAFGQQRNVARCQVAHDGVKTLPEGAAVHTGAGQHLVFDEAVQGVGHLQAVDVGAFGHGQTLNWWMSKQDAPPRAQGKHCIRFE